MRGDNHMLAASRPLGADHFDSRLAMLSRCQQGIRIDPVDRTEKRSWARPEQGIRRTVAVRSLALPDHQHQRAHPIPLTDGYRARQKPGAGELARTAQDGLAASEARVSNAVAPHKPNSSR
jgi:hypothetical protein